MTDHSFTTPTGTRASPAAVTRHLTMNAVRRSRRTLRVICVLVLAGGLAGVWTFVAHQQLASAVATQATSDLDHANTAFAIAIARQQASLQAQCRVLVEDPRLKSTLATEGIDEATVADILADLSKLRGSGFLMVLSSDGRVFAQSGAPELRGLDLSASSVVKRAHTATATVAGSWVIAGRVMDLSIMAIRYGEDVIAFLVVGEAVDPQMLQAVSAETGVYAANAIAGNVLQTSSPEPMVRAVLTYVATEAPDNRTITVDGYTATVIPLGDTAQAHRLVLARPTATIEASFGHLRWLIWGAPLLVLIAVAFSISVFRRNP